MMPANIPILAFHQLPNETASIFESYTRYVFLHDYHCLSLPELLRDSRIKQPFWQKTFILTFDDGYEDFLITALPILHHYHFSATVFIVTDLVGGKSNWEGESGNSLLSWEQIKMIQKAGVTIGSHTCSHPRLPYLSEQQIWHELTDSKKCLEDRLSQEILVLAYPHGESNLKIQQLTEAAGYKLACGLMGGKYSYYNLSRRSCNSRDDLKTLIYKSSRRYGLRKWFREDILLGQFLHKVKHRSF
jgi:peptidoglycan/xylan/chitin deacetylase (PgdA/CDA1 family)